MTHKVQTRKNVSCADGPREQTDDNDGTRGAGLTSVRVRVRDLLDLPLGFGEEGGDGSRVADVAVALKLGANLDRLVPPQIPADIPAGAECLNSLIQLRTSSTL